MKIYTRTGDEGKTHSFLGGRLLKDDPFIEACGTVDELNALLGMVRSESPPDDIDRLLHRIQHELFAVGADLAMLRAAGEGAGRINEEHVDFLEKRIDEFEEQLPPLREFVLPGGCRVAATVHLARTVCRRAERRVVTFGEACKDRELMVPAIRYLNRMSDLLFVLARVANVRSAVAEQRWQKGDKDVTGA